MNPLANFHLKDSADPTGNGQITKEIVYIDPTTQTEYRLAVFLTVHNSDGPQIILGAADSCPAYTISATSPQSVSVSGALVLVSLG
jgi:hypothetical protein